MKDLSNPALFDDHETEFNNAQKRVIKSSEWNDKLREIKEWQEEQERLKGRQIEDDLGSYQAYEQTNQLSAEERKEQLEKNRKTPYEQKVEEIRKTLNMPDPNRNSTFSTMGAYGSNVGMGRTGLRNNKRSNSAIMEKLGVWFKSAILGRELSTLEIDNNKKLLKNAEKSSSPGRGRSSFMGARGPRMGGFGSSKMQIFEDKDTQQHRMDEEDWRGYLYSYRVSGVTAIASGIMTALKIKIAFFAPSYFILIPAVASLGYISMKLKEFSDGPFFKNFLGNDSNIDAALTKYKKEKEEKKKKEEEESGGRGSSARRRAMQGRNRFVGRDRMSERRRSRPTSRPRPAVYDDDDEDEDEIETREERRNKERERRIHESNDEVEEKESEEHKVQEQIEERPIVEVTKSEDQEKKELKEKLLEPKENPSNEFEIPRSKMNLKDKKKMYEFEDDFLRWVYLNRKEFSKFHEPKDILQIFAPMIVNYNDSYAVEKEVDRESPIFKNLVYVLTRTFGQMSPKFANADEHDPGFYFCIDEIKETGLFYKLKIRLPQSVDKNRFVKNSDLLSDTLKKSDKDVVDLDVEMPNDEGYIKIMRLTVNSKGSAFLPLVSTGDVLRFKGMTADGTNKGVVEQMNEPNDLSLLFGLTNAEYAKVFDIADDQNTSIVVAGFTGSGKSASTGSWLDNLLITHSPDELGIIIMDAKSGSFWENFRFAPHVLGYFGREDIEKYPAIYQILNDVYTYRQNHLNKDVRMKNFFEARKTFKKNAQWDKILTVPRLLIVGDEQLATLTELSTIDNTRAQKNKMLSRDDKKFASFNDTYNSNIGSLANVVREGGMTIMGLSQRTDVKSYPRTLLGASSIKFIMKLQFQADAEKVAPGVDLPPIANLPVGSGYIYANGINLSQLTTPLFSGDPDLLEEMTRIIGLAWIIIQSYKEDLSKEPQGYYLTAATKDNAKLFKEDSIEPFNLFNRDKTFEEAKEILRTGERVHFSPDAEEGRVHIDLDASEHIWEPSTGRPASESGGIDKVYIGNRPKDQDDAKEITEVKERVVQQVEEPEIEENKDEDTIRNVQSDVTLAQDRQVENDEAQDRIEQEESQQDISHEEQNDIEEQEDNESLDEESIEEEKDGKTQAMNDILSSLFTARPEQNQKNDEIIEDNSSNIESIEDTLNKEIPSGDTISEEQHENDRVEEENAQDKPEQNDIQLKKTEPEPKQEVIEKEHKEQIPLQKRTVNAEKKVIEKKPVVKKTMSKGIMKPEKVIKNNEEETENIYQDKKIMKKNDDLVDKNNRKKPISHNSEEKKDELTVNDLRNYFITNDVHSMPVSDLTELFNMETIRMAINRGIVSIDTRNNEVTLI